MNKPMKKNIVFHSTSWNIFCGFSNNNKNAAPAIAVTQVWMCVMSCSINPMITSNKTSPERIIKPLSVIVCELSSCATFSIFSLAATNCFLKINARIPTLIINIAATIPVNSLMKSIKESPAALPIIMFGGSPINVAVPPMFDAKISVIKNGIGLISNSFAITNVTGMIKMTVVTLSRNAETIAVNIANDIKINFGLPFVNFNISFAIQLNIPLLVAIDTIIIIETRRNITLKSTKLIKYPTSKVPLTSLSCPNKPKISVKAAPNKATVTLGIFSVAINTYATINIAADTGIA